jgi:hypothetical protein
VLPTQSPAERSEYLLSSVLHTYVTVLGNRSTSARESMAFACSNAFQSLYAVKSIIVLSYSLHVGPYFMDCGIFVAGGKLTNHVIDELRQIDIVRQEERTIDYFEIIIYTVNK